MVRLLKKNTGGWEFIHDLGAVMSTRSHLSLIYSIPCYSIGHMRNQIVRWRVTDEPSDPCCWNFHVETYDAVTGEQLDPVADVLTRDTAQFIVWALNSRAESLEAARHFFQETA